MCSAWAIIRPRSSKSAVEQSRRSLMLAEKAERMRTAPISSATARSALPRTCSSMFTSREALQRADPIRGPRPPGGNPAGGAVELDDGRARAPRAASAPASASVGPRRTSAVRTATSSIGRARGRRSRSAPRGRGGTRPPDRRPSGTVSSNDWPGSAGRPRRRPAARRPPPAGRACERDAVAPLVARDETERGEDAGGLGHEHRPDPELLGERARVQWARRRRRRRARSRADRGRARRRRRAARAASRRSRPRRRRRVERAERALGGARGRARRRRRAARGAARAAGSRR